MTEETEVSLAVLGTKLDGVHTKLDENSEKLDDINGIVRVHDRDIARLKERQGIFAVLQSAFTAIAATVAGYLGART